MSKWNLALLTFFFSLGLLTSNIWLKDYYQAQFGMRSGVLAEADVTNFATINMPTLTPTPSLTPTTTPSPSPTPTTTPRPSPTPTLAPGQPSPTPSPTSSVTPTITLIPTTIAEITPEPEPPPIPGPTTTPEQYYRYSLFGYTSSYASVRLEGVKLIQGTKANRDGYFEFLNFQASNRNTEFCISSVDTENLTSLPLCVPVPTSLDNRKYGPYLLPPTLAVSKGDLNPNEQTTVSGKTIPGSHVNIFVFSQAETPLAARIIKPVLAAEADLPETYKLATNADGSFSTILSSKTAGKKRVFSQGVFSQNKTPKSVTLTVNILSIFLTYVMLLFSLLKSLLNLNFILFLQVLLIAYLLVKRKAVFNWYALHKKKQLAIVRYHQQPLVVRTMNFSPLKTI